ncbi:MAG: hypothetical protein ACI8P9_003350 [Parasphingorhabdus sp.]|jgi:hypothetical protein
MRSILHRLFYIVTLTAISGSAVATQLCQESNITPTNPISRFEVSSDGTVVDTTTGLMWQRCLVVQGGQNCETGDVLSETWAGALTYLVDESAHANLAGYKDWRMPNIRELASIVELQCGNPAINVNLFPNNSAGHVWSSSPYRFYLHYSWYLDFNDGILTYGDRQDKKAFRLVRLLKPH